MLYFYSMGSTFPGLRMPLGSSSPLSPRISFTTGAGRARASHAAFAWPIPCSALMEPPSPSTHSYTQGSMSASSLPW